MLLVGSLLFVRSLRNLVTLDAGFTRDHILVVRADYERLRLPRERRVEFAREILERVRALPGVSGAANARIVPLGGDGWNEHVSVEGTDVRRTSANFNLVGPGYFRAMETTLLAGRDFDARDTRGSEPVAIVTETFARKFLDGGKPDRPDRSRWTTRAATPSGASGSSASSATPSTASSARTSRRSSTSLDAQDERLRPSTSIVVRSELPLTTLLPSLKAAVAGVSPEVAVTFRPFRDILRDGLLRERLMASLSAFFGFLAAMLAMVGLYGVVSFMVVRRRNEIGVRMAMGATRRDILVLVMREAGTLLAIGLAVGIVLAVGAARFARSLLYGLGPSDPATIVVAAIGLAAVAAAASLLPAHRAAALDPVTALRDE